MASPTLDNSANVAKTIQIEADAEGVRRLPPQVGFEFYRDEFGIKKQIDSNYYENARKIASGGVGMIIAATDPSLHREMAIKVMKPAFVSDRHQVERFVREARATSQIEHPNIVPVHELGCIDGVGPYYTMKKVEGATLKEILDGLRAGKPGYASKYGRARLLDFFISICNGVAYAHSKGVIHRDLKPENIIVGDFGEVLVMDWGLVRMMDEQPASDTPASFHDTPKRQTSASMTMDGSIFGTPSFMPPEQAWGRHSQVDQKSDIYSLGAILYQTLTLELPFEGSVDEVIRAVRSGTLVRPRLRAPKLDIPKELEAVCLKAMSREQDRRYATVKDFIKDIQNHLDGFPVSAWRAPLLTRLLKFCRRHKSMTAAAAIFLGTVALAVSAFVMGSYLQYSTMLMEADKYKELYKTQIEDAKRTSAEIRHLERFKAVKTDTMIEEQNRGNLEKSKALAENHFMTAVLLYAGVPPVFSGQDSVVNGFEDLFKTSFDFHIGEGDYNAIEHRIKLLKDWFGNDFEKLSSNLRGKVRSHVGNVRAQTPQTGSLETRAFNSCTPTGVWRLENKNGIITPNKISDPDMGQLTPGSYLITAQTTGGQDIRFPVLIARGVNTILELAAPPDSVPDGMVYVPAGSFIAGGDQSAHYRSHIEGIHAFHIKQHEVTVAEYLQFWNNLDSKLKSGFTPRIRPENGSPSLIDAWSPEGVLSPEIIPDEALAGITREAATAYCQWLGDKLGRVCRLPTDSEWEKAGRGVDGREYPWGDGFRSTYAFTHENSQALAKFEGGAAPPGSFPEDSSVYGVMDMGGNVREWTSTLFPADSDFYQIKGASFRTTRRFLPCANSSDATTDLFDIGFRYIFEIKNDSAVISN